ncbi:MAG TPA: amidohydrolase family protein [Pyrinomonadaceae bacterium]|nr:amidohydrolase family protein [Pyrinomonadaceae bacterium]
MRRLLLAAVVLAAASLPVWSQTIAITGGKVYPVSGPPIANGAVLIRDGVIVAVGANINIPASAQRIDATGKIVTPGLINSITTIGLVEIGQVRDTNDAAAKGNNNIAAAFKPWEGLNPASQIFAPTRAEGVTTVIITPRGGLVSGQAAAIDLLNGQRSEVIRRSPVAMIAQIDDAQSAGTNSRGELIAKLRTLFDDVKFYVGHRLDYDRAATRTLSAPAADLEPLIEVVYGRMPIVIDADRVDEIDAALALAREYKLKLIISGGAESWLAADRLAAAHVPVLTGAMNNIPDSFARLNQRQETAAMLRRAGVQVVLVGNTDGDENRFNARNIKYEAGNAVAYGMNYDDALRAITLTPAELFGLSDRVGSLQAGRDANVVVWSGDPFEFSTRAEHVFIHGREFKEPSRQDLLIERYKPKASR